jgi:hypothetical protein
MTVPWPQTAGPRFRIANTVEALSWLGDVDLFVMPDSRHHEDLVATPGPDAPVARFGSVVRPPRRGSSGRRLAALARGGVPVTLDRDYTGVRAAFAVWAGDRAYDLAWFHLAETYVALAPCLAAPAVVDLDVLEDHKGLQELDARRSPEAGSHGALRPWSKALASRKAGQWRALYRAVARAVPTVLVCSELDRGRLAAPNAMVVSNGYDPPERPVGRVRVGSPPTVTVQGYLDRPVMADAIRFLVRSVLPSLRQRVPDVRLRLVGRASPAVRQLHDPPHIVVTGFVPDMAAELARSDVIAVPIRFAGGTRIKILEAFAHRIPVVSTTVGAEGIEAVAGRHMIVGDTPGSFADGCVELLTNESRRRSIVDEAERLLLERYRWSSIRETMTALAAAAVRDTPRVERMVP